MPDDPSPQTVRGALKIFTFRGIPVFVHWSWLAVGVLELQWRRDSYDSLLFNVAEYLGLFLLVLLHEFGHALACRSVGGEANRILLWPLGGIAYVQPPPRPGAMLWSLAAGPLVNLILAPVLIAAALGAGFVLTPGSDSLALLTNIAVINFVIMVFNLLPVYPLDGGQILQSLLWYVIGRERSLVVAAGMGLLLSGAGAIAALALLHEPWLGLIGAWAAWRCYKSLKVARTRMSLQAGPRHAGIRCPACGESPPSGRFWSCPNGHGFDPFMSGGRCPECDFEGPVVPCIYCGGPLDLRASGALPEDPR